MIAISFDLYLFSFLETFVILLKYFRANIYSS